MSRHGRLRWIGFLGFILVIAGALFAQRSPRRVLVLNGRTTDAVVTQSGGRSYVDIESLASAANGTVSFEAERVLLTIPLPGSSGAPAAVPAQQQLSRDFSRAAIAQLAEMREWRGTLVALVTFNVQVVGTWPQDYRDRAQMSLMQAKLAATSPADQNGFQLLQNEFSLLEAWAVEVVATRRNLDATRTVDPNFLQNNSTLAKISDCGRFLNSMLVSGTFSDDPSCH
jgi:hypothetical protein